MALVFRLKVMESSLELIQAGRNIINGKTHLL